MTSYDSPSIAPYSPDMIRDIKPDGITVYWSVARPDSVSLPLSEVLKILGPVSGTKETDIVIA